MTPLVVKRSPSSRCLRRWSLVFPLGCLLVALTATRTFGQSVPLTNAADVLALPAEQAAKFLPIIVRGVVVAGEPTWGGRFFVQDETSGVFVENLSTNRPEIGDFIEVHGVSHPGAFAPIITGPWWRKLGTAPLPPARVVPIEQVMSGAEDGQRVEVVGIVRAVQSGKVNIDVDIASGGYRLHAFPKTPEGIEPQNLIGARVRIRGTVAATFNATLRQRISVALFVPLKSDFVVEQTEAVNPFDAPLLPLNAIAQYRKDLLPGKRVHVKGVVTLQRPGVDLFLEGPKGGLHVKTRQNQALQVGDVIEAVGFPEVEHFLPVLDDALFRKTSETSAPAEPKVVPVKEILAGLHHADLITLRAKLLDRNFRQGRHRWNTPVRNQTVLMLQHEDLVFTAEAESNDKDDFLATIPIGSIVEVSGVCFTESGEDKKITSLQVLLPSPASVKLLKRPSWWTPQRLLIGLGLLLVVLVAAVSWLVMISKKNLVLNGLIREKEVAQHELQQAHDQLEERVKERTAQLKFQITARKESEVQYKGVITERTRLAQEIHDTLEQSLTGIALQLDTTSKLFQAQPDNASRHLELARELVVQSQVEVRRSVWDLRSRALEQFDLPGALVTSGKQLIDGTNIKFDVQAKGRVRPLPETVEDNLLRIAQEALTNVIKHSQATATSIELDYGPKTVTLQIMDNGRGLPAEHLAGPSEGHFGLLGISERAKRLGTEAIFERPTGGGTLVRVQVAIDHEFPALEGADI
jgi:signal transduction histidine kinase